MKMEKLTQPRFSYRDNQDAKKQSGAFTQCARRLSITVAAVGVGRPPGNGQGGRTWTEGGQPSRPSRCAPSLRAKTSVKSAAERRRSLFTLKSPLPAPAQAAAAPSPHGAPATSGGPGSTGAASPPCPSTPPPAPAGARHSAPPRRPCRPSALCRRRGSAPSSRTRAIRRKPVAPADVDARESSRQRVRAAPGARSEGSQNRPHVHDYRRGKACAGLCDSPAKRARSVRQGRCLRAANHTHLLRAQRLCEQERVCDVHRAIAARRE